MFSAPVAKAVTIKPEKRFITAYQQNRLTDGILRDCIGAIPEGLTIPSESYGQFTIPQFNRKSCQYHQIAFCDAAFNCLSFIAVISGAVARGESVGTIALPIFKEIAKKLDDTGDADSNALWMIMGSALGIGCGDESMLDRCLTAKTMQFLAEKVVSDGMICKAATGDLALEVVGRLFVVELIQKREKRLRMWFDMVGGNDGEGQLELQSFLTLVTALASLIKDVSFAEWFMDAGSNVIYSVCEFESPKMFCTTVKMFAALCRNEALAEKIVKQLDNPAHEVVNMTNMLNAIKGHARDFANELGVVLNVDDANGMIAVYELVAALFFQSEQCRKSIGDAPENELIALADHNGGGALFGLILAPVPTHVKAGCFDVLAGLGVDQERSRTLWHGLHSCHILTERIVEIGNGGILTDINNIEKKVGNFALARSFVRFLSVLLRHQIGIDFRIYHRFLFEYCLLKIPCGFQKDDAHCWSFTKPDEKWALICELCQCWTNMIMFHSVKLVQDVFRSACCDVQLVSHLVSFAEERQAPQEVLLCIFRLLLKLSEKEHEFRESMMRLGDRSSFISVRDRVKRAADGRASNSSDLLPKLMRCVATRDRDLQLVSISLAQHLTVGDPIVQQVFSERRVAKILEKCISVNEDESGDGDNVRNTILRFLPFLGWPTLFVKDVVPTIVAQLSAALSFESMTPMFVRRAMEILSDLCDERWTHDELWEVIRVQQSLFDGTVQVMLQGGNADLTAIGYYLRILAREASGSWVGNGVVTKSAFRMLMGYDTVVDRPHRVSFMFQIVDLISESESDESVVQVALGVYESIVAYGSNPHIQKELNESEKWGVVWYELLCVILKKARKVVSHEVAASLGDAAAFMGELLFNGPLAGQVGPGYATNALNLTVATLRVLHSRSYQRNGMYALIAVIRKSSSNDIDVQGGVEAAFYECQHMFFAAACDDILDWVPVVRATVFTATGYVMEITSEHLFLDFVDHAIESLGSTFNMVLEDSRVGNFVLTAHLSFFARLATYKSDIYLRRLVDRRIVSKLMCDGFWNAISSSYNTCHLSKTSESMIEAASSAIRILSCLLSCESFENDEERNNDVITQIVEFFGRYISIFQAICGGSKPTTLTGLRFLSDLLAVIALAPELRKIDSLRLNEVVERVRLQLESKERWCHGIQSFEKSRCSAGRFASSCVDDAMALMMTYVNVRV